MNRLPNWTLLSMLSIVMLAGLAAAGCSSSGDAQDPSPATAADPAVAQPATHEVTPPSRPPMDLPLGQIPADQASGQVRGQEFVMNGADLRKNVLTLHGDHGLRYFVFLKTDQDVSPIGRSFEYVNADSGVAHVHVHYSEGEGYAIEKFADGFTLRLELDDPQGRKVPGRIYLAVPDDSRSFIAGSFEAEILG